MPISRRGFLGRAAVASAAGVAAVAGLDGFFPPPAGFRSGCLLVDPGPASLLRESANGYAAALSALNISYHQTSIQSLVPARAMVVPVAANTEASSLTKVTEHLENGSVILYESGAAFLGPKEFGFHKRVIRSVFGLSLHDPVRLWDSADSFKQSPYVDYHWPVVTKVRDFSRIVRVDPGDGEIVAWFHDLPVAAKRRIGKGTLVFLGSPLGPHLLSADREASRWLGAFCSSC
jgi:hypothetical protein